MFRITFYIAAIVAMLAVGVLSLVYPEAVADNVSMIAVLLFIGAVNTASMLAYARLLGQLRQAYPEMVISSASELAKLFAAIKDIEDTLHDDGISPTKEMIHAELTKRGINTTGVEIQSVSTIEGEDKEDVIKRMIAEEEAKGVNVIQFEDIKSGAKKDDKLH